MDHPALKLSVESHLLSVVEVEVMLSLYHFSVLLGCVSLLSVGCKAFVSEGRCLACV